MKPRLLAAFLVLVALCLVACPPTPPEKIWVDVCNSWPDVPPAAARLATPYCPGHHLAQYVKGTEPKAYCDIHGAVMVEVCKESGLLPTECCREKETRAFVPGEEPTERCGIHVKVQIKVCATTGLLPNDACPTCEIRDFCPDEKPIATCAQHVKKPIPSADRSLICYGLMGVLGDGQFCTNGEQWLTYDGSSWTFRRAPLQAVFSAISDAGANAVRIFAWGVFSARPYGKASQFQAFKLAGDRWDLSQYNDYYFPTARQVVETANICGLTVLWDFLDQCEVQGGAWRQYSPWCNNIQGGYDIYDSKIWPQIHTFMLRCIDEFSGLDVVWGFNETSWNDFRPFASQVYFPVIKERSLDPTRLRNGAEAKMPVYHDGIYDWAATPIDIQHWVRADAEEVFGELDVLRWVREVHGSRDTARPGLIDAYLEAWGNNPIRTMFSDDGVWDGDSLCDSVTAGANATMYLANSLQPIAAAAIQARPSAAMWKAIAGQAYKYQTEASYMGQQIKRTKNFEHVIKNPDLACQTATIRAISEAYKEKFGNYPGNFR